MIIIYIDQNTIITASAILAAVISIFTVIFAAYRWYLRQGQQHVDIEKMKEEQCLLTYGVLACLKGLQEQGCNGPVTEAANKIEKHLNQQAHE